MPSSYSGFSRPRKSTKSSGASTISTSSKTSKPSLEKAKKDVPPVPPPAPAAPRGVDPSGPGSSSKAQPAPMPMTELKGKEKKEVNPLNVFEYLETDSETDSDSDVTSSDDDDLRPPFPPSSKPKGSTTRQPNTAVPVQNRPRASSVKSKEATPPGSFDASPVAAPLQLTRQNTAHRRPSTDGSISVAGSYEGSLPPEHRNLELVPEDYYPRPSNSLRRASFPPSPPQSPEEDLRRSGRKIRRNTKSSRLPTGYGLVAWRLSTSAEGKEYSIPPLYRRFEDVNHRVLLYLQDEISQLEEELRVLDDYEDMQRRGVAEQEGTKVMPASRRMDVQAQAYSSLHYRREEVMGSLIQKTEQYNNALAAYSKVLQTLPRATPKDVDTYRKWMKGNTPVATNEMRFLDHAKDLVSLTPQIPATASPITPPVYSAIIIASAAIILPLLAFSMIAEFAGRIIVVAVVGGASAAVAAHYSSGTEHIVKSQDGWRCAGLYFGFMTISALFIS
ncbi:uncharacterized protein BJX67DRAFT_382454 [Aspergillus lucknowensis]|uniref:DUF6594 domain-containing protein n=1 Tax=Aspergillus lucknowensis TaxID=176173 RepID=A0ABR4LQU8_9EURO